MTTIINSRLYKEDLEMLKKQAAEKSMSVSAIVQSLMLDVVEGRRPAPKPQPKSEIVRTTTVVEPTVLEKFRSMIGDLPQDEALRLVVHNTFNQQNRRSTDH